MKKLLSLLAAFTLIFGFSVNAFAVEYTDSQSIPIDKVLTITNEGTVNPAETFEFTVGTGSVDSIVPEVTAPMIENFKITVNKGETKGTIDIDLPEFPAVGVYTYKITEDLGDTAGMVYDGNPYFLVITVINNPKYGQEGELKFLRVLTLYTAEMIEDPDDPENMIPNPDEFDVKTDSFDNKFNAGDLIITKEVTGNAANMDELFTVTVTLTPLTVGNEPEARDIYISTIKVVQAGTELLDSDFAYSLSKDPGTGVVTITFKVKDGSKVTLENIPYNVNYEVKETVNSEYVTTIDGDVTNTTGEVEFESRGVNVDIENNKDTDINTGITLDSIPYILLLGFAVLGMGVLFFRKRQNANF